ncbi:MAG TPA: DUF1559 domain-containing protein [Gemmataceae bacterium]|nr:DUF1559 domain-containing protein [Gemmataceae bacterium]
MFHSAFVALFLAAPAVAQPPGRAEQAAPFIDEHTLVYVRVDVSRLDVETLLKLASVLGDKDAVKDSAQNVRKWVSEFVKKGGRDVFLTFGPGDYPYFPAVVIPVADAAGKELGELVAVLFKEAGRDPVVAQAHGSWCVGTKEAQAVVKDRKAVARPELAAAIEAGRDAPVQVAFALSEEAKKIHEQVAPTLPTELGGGGIQKVTRGLKWSALTIGAGPKLPTKWVVEAASPLAAQDLKGLEGNAREFVLAAVLRELADNRAERRRLEDLVGRYSMTVEGTRLTSEWELATTILEAVQSPTGPPAERIRSANNLKQLMLALHNYHDTYERFPADVTGKDGKPLLSWRVLILPYIDQADLFRQFKLDEPWDSPHNRPLAVKMPKTFRSPRQAEALRDRTTYLAPLGKGLMWDDPKGVKMTQVSDGTSNTIALVEADDERAVIWSKPEDITIDPKNPVVGLLGHYGDGFHAAVADGSVRFVKKAIAPDVLWALFTRAGGEVSGFSK